ncbi:MAG: hypothetical protein LBB20_03830 [Puniceicoccales bacterium]|jgi:hypothetical protein|nr:hypothetical protein [Puniceicoccales bacterium]
MILKKMELTSKWQSNRLFMIFRLVGIVMVFISFRCNCDGIGSYKYYTLDKDGPKISMAVPVTSGKQCSLGCDFEGIDVLTKYLNNIFNSDKYKDNFRFYNSNEVIKSLKALFIYLTKDNVNQQKYEKYNRLLNETNKAKQETSIIELFFYKINVHIGHFFKSNNIRDCFHKPVNLIEMAIQSNCYHIISLIIDTITYNYKKCNQPDVYINKITKKIANEIIKNICSCIESGILFKKTDILSKENDNNKKIIDLVIKLYNIPIEDIKHNIMIRLSDAICNNRNNNTEVINFANAFIKIIYDEWFNTPGNTSGSFDYVRAMIDLINAAKALCEKFCKSTPQPGKPIQPTLQIEGRDFNLQSLFTDKPNFNGMNILHMAAFYGNYECVKFINKKFYELHNNDKKLWDDYKAILTENTVNLDNISDRIDRRKKAQTKDKTALELAISIKEKLKKNSSYENSYENIIKFLKQPQTLQLQYQIQVSQPPDNNNKKNDGSKDDEVPDVEFIGTSTRRNNPSTGGIGTSINTGYSSLPDGAQFPGIQYIQWPQGTQQGSMQAVPQNDQQDDNQQDDDTKYKREINNKYKLDNDVWNELILIPLRSTIFYGNEVKSLEDQDQPPSS